MTNSNPRSPSPPLPPSYASNPAAGSAMARRSSYASVLSGNASNIAPTNQSVTRPNFFPNPTSNQPSAGSPPHPTPPHRIQSPNRPPEVSHSFNGGQHSSEIWERAQLPHYSASHGQWSEGIGAQMMEPKASDFFVPSYLMGSKHIERLEEKYKARLAAQRDGKLGRSANGAGTLSSSASSMSLHKMVPSHRGMTYEIQEKHPPAQEDVLSPLPTKWSTSDKFAGLEVGGDGSELKFTGQSKTPDEAAAVRADHPMPKECGIYYFEVTVLGKGKEGLIGIGFSSSKVALNRLPGWEPESWAYHGDDGNSFCQTASGKAYGPRFGYSDVIGCGVNFKNGTSFFTKNGVNLGIAFRDIKAGDKLYPSVGMKKPGEHIKINFGQTPFIFDIDGMVAAEREELFEEIASEDASHIHSRKSETSLLQELVAQYLAHDGYIEAAKTFAEEVNITSTLLRGAEGASKELEYKEDRDAINRQRIRAAILEGDVDKALKHTRAHYPSVLHDNENIYFKLRCRKFIEMIKRSTELQPRPKRTSSTSMFGSPKVATNGHNGVFHDDYEDVFENQGTMELDGNSTVLVDFPDGKESERMDLEDTDIYTKQNNLMNDAIEYGRELRAEFKDDPRREVKQALEDTFALIAYPDARESSLAPLLEVAGRVPVAEELNSAILVSLGQSSSAALERLVQQTEALVGEISSDGGAGALINVRNHFLR